MKKNKDDIFKSFIIIVFLFVYPNTIRSQAYTPMLTTYAEWHVTNCYFGCLTDKYYTVGDTVINTFHYKFLDLYHYNKNFVIREDTNTRKIYMRLLFDPMPAKEYLLYDFSLHVNDTTSIQNPGSPYPKYAGSFVVDSIKLKPLVNKSYRFFYLHALDSITSNTKTTIWVEGIGSLCLINTPGAMPQINGIGQLTCYFNNGTNEYSNLDSITDCTPVHPLGIKEINEPTNYLVTQNFDSKNISIIFKKEDIYKIQIYSIDGKLLFYKENSDSNHLEINIEPFTKGLLFLKIENENGFYSTYKLFNP
jgi:hypothetical protein